MKKTIIPSLSTYISALFLILVLTNCKVAKSLRQLNQTDVSYSEYTSEGKDYVFIDMVHVRKPEFYENVMSSISEAKANDYVLFYEYIDFDLASEEEKLKIREMVGFIPSPEGYANMLGALISQGYKAQDNNEFLGIVNDKDYNVDVTPSELIEAYESRYGAIEITETNRATPISQAIKPSVPNEQMKTVILDFRNEYLAKAIHESDHDKILVLYGAEHREGLFLELQKLNATWKEKSPSLLADVKMKQPANPIVEDGHIEKIQNKMGVRVSISNDIEGFIVDDGVGQRYEIFPNTSTVGTVKLIYKFFSLNLTKFYPNLSGDNTDTAIKGETSNFSIGSNLNFNRWVNRIEYTRTTGYYLENTSDYLQNWNPGDPYIQFPDLQFSGVHGSTGYKLNPRLSFNAITQQSERQLLSAGSIIPRFTYRFFTIDDKTPITGTSVTQKTNNRELMIGVGYYHTIVKNDFYLSLGLTPSVGKHYTKLTTRSATASEENSRNTVMTRLDGMAALGYNGELFFAGLETTFNASSYNQENATASIGNSRFIYQIFAGYRFNIPKSLR